MKYKLTILKLFLSHFLICQSIIDNGEHKLTIKFDTVFEKHIVSKILILNNEDWYLKTSRSGVYHFQNSQYGINLSVFFKDGKSNVKSKNKLTESNLNKNVSLFCEQYILKMLSDTSVLSSEFIFDPKNLAIKVNHKYDMNRSWTATRCACSMPPWYMPQCTPFPRR